MTVDISLEYFIEKEVLRMKDKYYHQAPVLFFFGGVIGGLLLFITHGMIYDGNPRLFWLVTSALILATCSRLGMLVKKLYCVAIKDRLTGLFNRNYFYEMLAYEVKRTRRYQASLSLIMIDVDNFKTVNDTRGHLEGDRVLIELSKILKSHVRATDIICRWGGEEFAIILPETDAGGAYMLSERIRKAIENMNSSNKVTICAGVSEIKDEMNIDRLIASADKALYQAKTRKNSVMMATGLKKDVSFI